MRLDIRRRLQGSFALIALTALGIAASNYLQYRRLEGEARAISLVGSQRARSYQLAMLAAEHVAFPDRATEESIYEELARFRTVLDALRPPTSEAAAALEGGREIFESYELSVRAIVRDANERARVEGGRGREPELRAASEGLAATAAALAEAMDRATAEFVRASDAAVRRYRSLQLALFAATAAIALVSFEGMRRSVLRVLPALEAGLHDVARGRLGAEVHLGGTAGEVERLEAAFNEMTRELERLERMKSEFVANVSHELRTPLASVIGFADHLRRGLYGPLGEKQLERVEAIHRNARRLLVLIGDILDLAKIEAGKLDVRPERVELGPLVADVGEALRPLADAKHLTLDVSVDPDVPAIVTDPERVRQVLLNLGSNAIKFTETGGVRLRAAALPDGAGARIDVVDTGIGIAPEDHARLFRRFEQVDGSGTRRHGGTGLGLHISRRIADLVGGRIEVESSPGRGSRFALVLPGSPTQTGRTDHADHQPTEAHPGRR